MLFLDDVKVDSTCVGQICAPVTSPEAACTVVVGSTNALLPYSDTGTFGIGASETGTCKPGAITTGFYQCCDSYGLNANNAFACNKLLLVGSGSRAQRVVQGNFDRDHGMTHCKNSTSSG